MVKSNRPPEIQVLSQREPWQPLSPSEKVLQQLPRLTRSTIIPLPFLSLVPIEVIWSFRHGVRVGAVAEIVACWVDGWDCEVFRDFVN
jgi:hypothetical protein